MVNEGWLGSILSETFLQMEFIIFQSCLIMTFLPGQSTPYNQLLIQPLLLVSEGDLNFKVSVLKF